MANDNSNSPKEAAMVILAKAQRLLDRKSSSAIEDIKVEDMKKSAEYTSGLHTVAYYGLDKHSGQQAALAILAKSQDMLNETISIKSEGLQKSAEAESGMHKVEYYKSEILEKGNEKGIHTPMRIAGAQGDQSRHGSQAGYHAAHSKKGIAGRTGANQEKGWAVGEHKKVLGEMHSMPKPNLPKSENPDEKQDAKLGEEVEHLCEDHMVRNASAERKEGHKLVSKAECAKCVGGMQKSEWAELYEDLAKMEKSQYYHPKDPNPLDTSLLSNTKQTPAPKKDPTPMDTTLLSNTKKPKMGKKEKADENEIGTKIVKSDTENKKAPSNEMKPKIEEKPIERDYQDFETRPGHAPENDHREEPSHPVPDQNPAAHGQGSNPPAGATPGTGKKGVHKLSFFMGHQHSKKSMKKGIALG